MTFKQVLHEMFRDMFVDPVRAAKTWGAIGTIAVVGLKWALGIEIGDATADAITTLCLFMLNPILVYWLANKKADDEQGPEEE